MKSTERTAPTRPSRRRSDLHAAQVAPEAGTGTEASCFFESTMSRTIRDMTTTINTIEPLLPVHNQVIQA